MSLPNGMEWFEDDHNLWHVWSPETNWDYYYSEEYETPRFYVGWHGSESGARPVRDKAHAELIIRAIEAPETLEVKE